MDTPLLDAVRSISVRDWLALGQVLLRITLIVVAAWAVSRVGNRMFRMILARLLRAASEDRVDRLETLGRVFGNGLSVVISLVVGMLMLDVLGISVAPILATAGVVGIAVGFGAQSLIKDYFNGFFLLVDDQLRQGDIVQIAGIDGGVEKVTLRYVRLRDYEGNVHFVPAGQIGIVTNRSRDFAFAVIDIGIAYRESVEAAIEVMRAVGREMRADEAFGPSILEDLEIAGVNEWAGSAIVIRCRFKVKAMQQWGVRRGFLQRLKAAFDAHGIEIPYPHLTVYAGEPKQGTAPAFNVRGLPGTAVNELPHR
jgi:small conductance mechanosensitive channel